MSRCRFCGGALSIPFCDLGSQPLANSYLADAGTPDPRYPLNAMACEACLLVQLDHVADAQAIFSDYAYFSSYSSTWLEHARVFAADIIGRLGLDKTSFVAEIASNDGYLLRNFVAAGIPCIGVEPAANVARAALGVPTLVAFFGREVAHRIVIARGHADLVVANNVLAHVPDINDFIAGLALLAGPAGVVSIEVPHLLNLIAGVQFDTIYHEHYAYFSLHALTQVLGAHGLAVIGVERVATHGGSLRVFASAGTPPIGPSDLASVRADEAAAGLDTPAGYTGLAPRVRGIIEGFRAWRATRGRVAAYGAAAKGNTFLNAVGEAGLLAVADRNPAKQGRLLPGSRVPVVTPEALRDLEVDDVLILPWNIAGEIAAELRALPGWRARLWVAVPAMREVT